MALFQKSLTFVAALGLPLALVACGGGDTGKDTSGTTDADADADGDTDTDADSDTDADADLETGLAFTYWVAGISAPGGTFSSGYMGLGFDGMVDGDWACRTYQEIASASTPTQPCEMCDYQFDVVLGGGASDGPWCAGLGITDPGLGWDGLSYGFGWGPDSYDIPQSDGSYYTVGDPIFLHYYSTSYPDGTWFPWLFDRTGAGYEFSQQDGDGFDARNFYLKQDPGGSVYVAYYFYYRY